MVAAGLVTAAPRDAPAPPFELVFEWTVGGNQDLYVVGVEGGPPRRLTSEPHVDALPRWSADGARVFFTSDRSGNWQVYSVPAAGGEARRVRDNPNREWQAEPSPDGRALALLSNKDGPESLYVMDLATGAERLLVRHGRGSQEPTAVKLRGVLLLVLGAGAIGAAVLMLAGLHVKGLGPGRRLPPIRHPTATPSLSFRPHPGSGSAVHVPVTVLLYALLVVVLLAGVAVSIWWARRLRPAIALRADEVIAEDPEQLREAVESGRSALRTVDDARAAIIACYLAMETTLAERGTARGAAGTPGELLTRATKAGLVRGTAAGQLTALFYEARFSSHPLGHQQRDAAERALDELAADLAQPEGAAR
jgi:hypothetical protein